MTADPLSNVRSPTWVQSLFGALGLGEIAPADEVYERSNKVAGRLAPNTRRLWRWILFLESLAVMVPFLWMAAARHDLPLAWIGGCAVAATLLVIASCWWLRWRAMRQTWSRARLVAELARSRLATRGWPGDPTRYAMERSPKLQPILDRIGPVATEEAPASFEERKNTYLEQRIDDQAAYYSREHEKAMRTRRRISKAVTRSLDAALFLAVAGLVIGLSSSAVRWLRLSHVELVLGLFGAALPLAAIVYQSFSSFLELDRRAGQYRQQEEFLEVARKRLRDAATEDDALAVVLSVERTLLDEITTWHYQTDSVEVFYRAKEDASEKVSPGTAAGGLAAGILGGLGRGIGFTARVAFGRGVVVALSAAITTAVIAYRFPEDALQRSMLRVADGRLLSSAKPEPWDPIPERAENGFVLIAHGLRGKAAKPGPEGDHWMTVMRKSLASRCGEKCPEICLVDWRFAASPARFSPDGFTSAASSADPGVVDELVGWVQDIARIRPHAEEVGDTVGYKLVRAVREGELDSDRPMHFIGHSAGGFVVVRAALILASFGLSPKNMRVTMLDTPMPSWGDLEELLEFSEVEYVTTSSFAQGVPPAGFHRNYRRVDVEAPEDLDPFMGAHGYAHTWFIESIAGESADGFGESPILR